MTTTQPSDPPATDPSSTSAWEVVLSLQAAMRAEEDDPARTLQAFADALLRLTGADACVLEECRGDELVVGAVAGERLREPGSRRPVSGSKEEPLLRPGAGSRPSRLVEGPAAARLAGIDGSRACGRMRYGLLVALAEDEIPLGVATLLGRGPPPRPDEQPLEVVRSMISSWLACRSRLAAEGRRHQLLVEALPVLVSYVDRKQRYQENNAAYGRWFGVDVDSIRGRHVADVLGRDAYEAIRPQVEAALAGDHVDFEAVIPYKDAGTRRVRADYVPDVAEDGTVLGFFALITDLEDRYRAERDFLTGTLSRRKLTEALDEHVATALRYQRPLSIALIDFDRFKKINDRFGHAEGDKVLRTGATLIGDFVRRTDLFGRWGGEEFLLVAPESGLDATRTVAERARVAVAEHDFGLGDSVTLSAGVATLEPGDTPDRLIERADRALYRAKEEGRNRVLPAADE